MNIILENLSEDQLTQNYQEMDETGQEKLLEVSEKILEIWETVNNED